MRRARTWCHALALTAVVAIPAAAQTPVPGTYVTRNLYARNGLVAGCSTGTAIVVQPGPSSVESVCTQNLGGGTPAYNYAAGSATTDGVLRSIVGWTQTTDTPYTLAPREVVQSFQSSGLFDEVLVSPFGGGAMPTSVVLWLTIDGYMQRVFGTPPAPGLKTDVAAAVSWGAGGDVAGAVSRVNFSPRGDSVSRGTAVYEGSVTNFVRPGIEYTFVNGRVGSHAYDVVDGRVSFDVSLGTFLYLQNTTGAPITTTDLRLWSDFSRTARLAGAQGFDAFGNDISSSLVFTTAGGVTLVSGVPAIAPEPATAALVATGLLALGAVARRRRRS